MALSLSLWHCLGVPHGMRERTGSQAKVREESSAEAQIGCRKCLYFSSGREDKQTLFVPSGQLCGSPAQRESAGKE